MAFDEVLQLVVDPVVSLSLTQAINTEFSVAFCLADAIKFRRGIQIAADDSQIMVVLHGDCFEGISRMSS